MDWQRPPDEMPSRNETQGFAERTRKNLDFVVTAHEEGADVHVITQLVLSLLGMVVFPFERHISDSRWHTTLEELQRKGWPEWMHNEDGYQPQTLKELIRVLRHATAHGNIAFSSDARLLSEVTISLSNVPRSGKRWDASIRADHLLDFCRRYLDYMWDSVA